MKHVVIEHVALDELPAAWRARLPVASNACRLRVPRHTPDGLHREA